MAAWRYFSRWAPVQFQLIKNKRKVIAQIGIRCDKANSDHSCHCSSSNLGHGLPLQKQAVMRFPASK